MEGVELSPVFFTGRRKAAMVGPSCILPMFRETGIRLRSLWVFAAIALLGMVDPTPALADARLTDLSFTTRSDGRGYVLRVKTSEQVKAYGRPEQSENHTLTWTLYNTGIHDRFEKPSPEGPVQGYTVSREDGHLTLRFRLSSEYTIEPSAYRDGASTDLLLNLSYVEASPVADASSEASSTGASLPVTGTEGPVSRSMQAIRERWKLDTVVIDPGHGGRDPGAVANGLEEKDIVLDVALQLGDYIENRLGVDVVYTRTDDRFIPLEERGKMANEEEAKLFISLHANASRAAAAHGTETYFLGPSKTDAAREVMERENSVIRYEDDTETYEEYDEQALVRQTLTQSAFMRQSEHLASRIQTQFEERVHRRNRGVHQAGFYVLWSASMPGVLVELGFLTNPQEARYLNSDRGQTYLASALFRAVRAYKNEYEKGMVAEGE